MATRDLNDIKSASYNKEELLRALRTGVIAELDAVNQYSIIAEATMDEPIKKIITDIMHEEQVHVGEFMKLIEKVCSCETDKYEQGKQEAAEKMANSLPGQALHPKPAIELHPSTFKKTKITFTAAPPVIVPPEQQPNNEPVQFPEEPEEEPEPEKHEHEHAPEESKPDFSIEQLNKELGQLLENDEEE